jgi:hypothetical protein
MKLIGNDITDLGATELAADYARSQRRRKIAFEAAAFTVTFVALLAVFFVLSLALSN